MKIDTKKLLEFVEGRLSGRDAEVVREALARDPDLRDELETIERLPGLLRSAATFHAEPAVSPFLADRVMKALARRRDTTLDEMAFWLVRWFRPVAAASMLIIGGLIVYNVNVAADQETAVTPAESIFGLPPVTMEVAYALNEDVQ